MTIAPGLLLLVAAVLGVLLGAANGYVARLRNRALTGVLAVVSLLPILWFIQQDRGADGVRFEVPLYLLAWAVAYLVSRHLAAKQLAASAPEPEDNAPAA